MRDEHRVRELILRYGWNSTCYQLLNPGFEYWFSGEFDAVVGFVQYARTRIVAGAPVCPFDQLSNVELEFERDALRSGLQVCYFASEARLESIIAKQPGYSVIRLGAQPVWHPQYLTRNMHEKSSLRGQLNRAWNKGVVVEEWPASRAANNATLHAVLRRWLSTRGLPSLHFLVEPETLSNQQDRRIFVATQGDQVIGFLNLSPVPERQGWLAEQFVRDTDAPNGTVELMLEAAANAIALDGYEYFTLGLSPLTQHAGPATLPERVPPFIRFLLRWARAHGKRFYNFEGLEFFKTKFEPEHWENIYAISNEPKFSLRSLYAIACAFTTGKPLQTVMAGFGKALQTEVVRMFK